ncbi:unnamed protein product [Caenorhabditis angaria]|uniref:Selenoprotein P N-terminal domain-containing protein n=1 Tax=Caenorhabditis angaria TaxID=860376 RepID=A0A9P1IBJ2_9PELO|nr:unnamed protein product [Caenorhabditis angaria]
MNFLLLILFSIFHYISSINVQICSPFPVINFRGSNDITKQIRGDVGAVVFSPLQCSKCTAFLRRLNEIGSNFKILLVAQHFEADHLITNTARTFPNLRIAKAQWSNYDAKNYDTIIIDQCGRITENALSSPRTDVLRYNDLEEALRRAATGNGQCGNCDPRYNNQAQKDQYVQQQQYHYPQYPAQQQQNQQYQQRQYPSHQQYIHQPYDQRNNIPFYTPPTPTNPPFIQKPTQTTTTTTESVADYFDYYDNENDNSRTTIKPQTQIQRPNIDRRFNQPTQPFLQNDQYELKTCNDEYCYREVSQNGNLNQAPCCKEGIYLTDVCVPGKCSNSTVQLCCFQKFLRAKYACCNDKTMDENTERSTNKFNKCCNENFLKLDQCCTPEAAGKYWKTVYDVCFPNIYVNYSSVSFEVHYTEGVRVHDMNKSSHWNFQCPFGKKAHQYAYLP